MTVYKCPICKQGDIEIHTTRSGPPGFRMTDYEMLNRSCDCITKTGEAISMAIIDSQEEFPKTTCELCGESEATVKYPTKSWVGEYSYICTDCFSKKMA
ncbi:hypothetical protein [Priestia megaterium]|uniref:hypothetical protein n=1 Tax=Priestia megaterium TaxID=1404 RepID=UPI0022B8B46D|nr:hypothetical protein [Priestia megaterium]MCZ8493602.1 hypothetical protein [Priestia megaterium]